MRGKADSSREIHRLVFSGSRIIRTISLLFLFVFLLPSSPQLHSTRQAVGQVVLRAAGGTWNFGPDGTKPGTIVGLRFEDFRERRNVAFTLRGPEGWNGSVPHSWVEESLWGPRLVVFREIPAYAGSYQLTAIAGEERIVITLSFDLTRLLSKPQFRVRILDRAAHVEVSPIPRAAAYGMRFVDLRSGRDLGGCGGALRDCQTLPLAPGQYRVTVSALTDSCCGIGPILFGANHPWPSEVHGSETTLDFTLP